MRNSILLNVFCVVFCLLFAPLATSQTNWSVEGSVPLFGEFNSPPPLCPTAGPLYTLFTGPPALPGCIPLFPFPFTCDLGGSAFDNDGNFLSGGTAFPAMLHTDGRVVEMVDAATGGYLMSWIIGGGVILPGPINGLGYDSPADVIWVTDGFFCAGVGLSPSCTAPPPIIVPPFMLPTPAAGFAPATGIDWDPCTGTLWYSDCGGMVHNCTTAGVLITSFFAIAPGLTPLLMGLTVNTATVPIAGSSPNVQVTDGFTFAEFTPAGALAPAGPFYLSSNPYTQPVFGAPASGLGFSLKPVNYGKGCPSPTGTVPSIGFTGGYPYIGNAGFTITMTGATPGTFAYLVVDTAMACPPLSLPGCPSSVWVSYPWLLLLPIGVVPAAGTITVPAPMPVAPGPCSANVGVPVFCQFINVVPGPTVWETSDALAFTIGDA